MPISLQQNCCWIKIQMTNSSFGLKMNKKYPLLAPLAQDILLIPASSTSIERIFQLLVTLQVVEGTDQQEATWNVKYS